MNSYRIMREFHKWVLADSTSRLAWQNNMFLLACRYGGGFILQRHHLNDIYAEAGMIWDEITSRYDLDHLATAGAGMIQRIADEFEKQDQETRLAHAIT